MRCLLLRLRMLAVFAVVLVPSVSSAKDVDFNGKVLPILSANCFPCHGPDATKRKANLRLDVRDEAVRGNVIVPGKPAQSELLAGVAAGDDHGRMPPPKSGGRLKPEEVRILREWVENGALYSEHWAFVPPKRPPVPVTRSPRTNPIDSFVLARLERTGLFPAPPADKSTLLRRVSLDLTGLPPTPAEIEAFLKDGSPNAYERVIDRLLASPHYGERWGRHWLDVARFADSGGFETDIYFGSAWRYRDYVIRSFNADKPFDRVIKEQIAGDELAPGDRAARVATGLYSVGPVLQEANMVAGKLEYDWLTDSVDTTGAAFLGLTIGCARCHDHKYDPISQRDYFGLHAVFAGSDQFDFRSDGMVLREGVALKKTETEFEQARKRTDPRPKAGDFDEFPEIPLRGLSHRSKPLAVRLLGRGELGHPGETIAAALPARFAPGRSMAEVPREKWRTELANWIASKENPLTARVIVNRVWQGHFGRGLVGTPNDFGIRGERPTHPELLDWLAVEFVESGWSLKKLHLLILTSATYRQSSIENPNVSFWGFSIPRAAFHQPRGEDPENLLLARFQPRRGEAEIVWDAMRVAAGTLDRKLYGLPVFPPLDERELIGNYKKWPAGPAEDANRRALYVTNRRSFRFPVLAAFDPPENTGSCGRRDTTIVPNQALTLLNSRASRDQAAAFAERLLRETGGSPEELAARAWLIAYGRSPSDEERDEAIAFLRGREKVANTAENPRRAALTELCAALFATNEFIYIPLTSRKASGMQFSRRHWLTQAGLGFGAWALLDLAEREACGNSPSSAKPPHFPAKARSVIFLMMAGGPSQMETFDPKPELDKLHGRLLPAGFGTIPAQFTDVRKQLLLGVQIKFRRCGQSGLPISDAFPHLRDHADRLAVIRSCHHDAFNHSPAQYALLTGQSRVGWPSVGSWVAYGLGTERDNLPALVVMTDPDGKVKGGTPLWGNGFLPPKYQGATLQTSGTPILYLNRPDGVSEESQRATLDFAQKLNRRHSTATPAAASELDARIAAYELAFKMQAAAPEAVDLQRETAKVRALYGLEDDATRDFGTRCLIARRLVERGVRFVQLISGSGDSKDWDHHDDSHSGTLRQARKVDRPIAALLTDLAARGLLDSTLVVWSGEFGRTPTSQSKVGRDHNPNGFTMWMAGGGIKGGKVIGATDEIGLRAVEDKVHMHDAHATILSLLGLDHRKLTYLHQGREQRLTDVGGDNDLSQRLTQS